jgi:hypothetical protein
MKWKGISTNCLSSEEGYLVSRYRQQFGNMFIARTPVPEAKIIYSGEHEDSAKAASVKHFESKMGNAA